MTRTHAARVPAAFRRKQTVAGGERFSLPELDDLADKILHAEERYRLRELSLFAELTARVVEPPGKKVPGTVTSKPALNGTAVLPAAPANLYRW